jgi:hypothetical protein
MTSDQVAPPLPRPQPADKAARALSHAAQAATSFWNNSMEPREHTRAVRQLCSALRNTGVATWGLAYYQTTDSTEPATAVTHFRQEVIAASRSMLNASECLEDALAAERRGVPNENEPGEVLCRTAWKTIRSWRRPTGTTADRDLVIEQLTQATETLGQAAHNLSFQAPEARGERLCTARSYLTDAAFCLTKARHAPATAHRAPAADHRPPRPAQRPPDSNGDAP